MKQPLPYQIDENFFRKFAAFQAYDKIQQLTEPLKYLGIKGFSYAVQYLYGRHSLISNMPNMYHTFYKEKMIEFSFAARYTLPNHILFFESLAMNNTSFCIKHHDDLQKYHNLLKQHSLSTGIAICKNHLNYHERFVFRFSHEYENKLMTIGCQHQDLLYHFINYFQEKGGSLIKLAHQNTILLPWKVDNLKNSPKIYRELIKQNDLNKFISKTYFKRIYLDNITQQIHLLSPYLTNREFDVVSLLTKGKNLLQIGKQLDNSIANINFHIGNIKKKLKCKTLFDLGFKLGKDKANIFL